MTLTDDEFAQQYADRSGKTVEWFRSVGYAPRPCGPNCDFDGCQGWIMTNAAQYDEDMAAFRSGEGFDPSHGANF